MISNYLLSFNSENEQYQASDSLIHYLDENHPDWRTLIVDADEFVEFFKTKVHIYHNDWLKTLANSIFNITNNQQLVESIWKDTTIDEWYRYAAIRWLILVEPNTYLPIYINELISGGFILGGYGFTMIDELYDFPNSIETVLDSKSRLDGNNFEFLARKACEYFDEYTLDVREAILKNRNYYIRRDCSLTTWKGFMAEEKLYLTAVIIANEYSKFHDVVTYVNYLNNHDESTVVLLNNDFCFAIKDEQRRHRVNIPHFDCPGYDPTTHQYTPSEQFSRFMSFAQTEKNGMSYCVLNKAFQELHHSQHRCGNN